MKLKVNPTRMELLKLRKRMRLAKRGHKLLKDKEEQLLIEFRTLVDEVKKERKLTEKNLIEFYSEVLKLKGLTDEKTWAAMIGSYPFKTEFHIKVQRIFNIPISKIWFKTQPEKPLENHMASPYFRHLVIRGKQIMEQLTKLCFLESKLISFASEIERTRRRVNALEFVLIPNISETIRFITFKLNENERTSLVTLKHIQLTRQE
ncbi:MAG TPA: V-type ATP synthase subunit D [bacterium]|nr:V-type ATP synthase subunit D [bacterium]